MPTLRLLRSAARRWRRRVGLALLSCGVAGGLWAQTAPSLTTPPPALVAVDPGATVTFTVVAAGTAPLSYQWLKNGQPLAGETRATLVIPNAQYGPHLGTYAVVVANAAGTVTSAGSDLRFNAAPYLITPPADQSASPGSPATFTCFALGWPLPTYQWRKDGVPIPGATDSWLSFAALTAADAGDYTVAVTNPFGSLVSDPATLAVSTGAIIQFHPAPQTVLAGQTAVFTVSARPGLPATFQWQQRASRSDPWADLSDAGLVSGATTDTLRLSAVIPAMDQSLYRCVVTNANGTEASNGVALSTQLLAYSGAYFGSLDAGGGRWALYLRGAAATFLADLPDRHSVIVLPLTVEPTGGFSAAGTERLAGDGDAAGSGAPFTLTGQISGLAGDPSRRLVTGTLAGLGRTLSGEFRAGGGALTPAAGDFYTALALKGDRGRVYAVVGYGGDTLAVVITPAVAEGARGTLALASATTAGLTAATPSGATLGLTVQIPEHALAATYAAGGATRSLSFLGLGGAVDTTAKLVNASVRAHAGRGDQTLIVGCVVAGPTGKPVLLRAIGPSLAPLGVAGVLANPRVQIFNAAGGLVGENDDWGGGAPLRTLGQSLGAFALDASSLDAAVAATWPAGAYTAQASPSPGGGGTAEGVCLVEAYDAEAGRATRLVNVSARALAGAGSDTLIAGFVITGNAPVTLLLRGLGPALGAYGVAGVLPDPRLQLFDAAGTLLAENDDWGGPAALAQAFAQAGAGTLPAGSRDAALLVTLAPGAYTAQVSSRDGTTGVALVEVYEAR